MQIIFQISKKERERLKIHKDEFGDAETLGVILTPSGIRQGIKRWQKQGGPSVFDGADVSEAVSVVRAQLEVAHTAALAAEKQKREAAEQTLLSEFEKEYETLNAETASKLQTAQQTFDKNESLYVKRLAIKDKKITELQGTLAAEAEKVQAYASHFGECRSHPLNRVQRLMGRLFRIFA